ncbi:MAG TPA: flagellar motor switch protein FliN [Nitrospirae bacterium]|nr:flagellar motor switch protein FliN [bacterium BMS3Abin06]HDH13221.1 flagellar motor switch protein FliN [Nitrospirota bacterium]HDZ01811.1 flagellar motor switch protein FliN [Nitrospirota bacterium]
MEAQDEQKGAVKEKEDGAQGNDIQQHEFNDLNDGDKQTVSRDIEFLLDIPVEITVQLGMTRMLIKELLQLGQGSVVELDKLAGEPMEILANNRLVARGEVVVVNEKFGVRLTDIISPTERLTRLK